MNLFSEERKLPILRKCFSELENAVLPVKKSLDKEVQVL